MSNIFSGKKAVKDQKVEDDFLGGGGTVETDIYPATIKYAYIAKAQNSGARGLAISLMLNDKHELTRTIWMTNRDGDVTYKDKKTGEEKNLPGYNQVNSLAMLVLSKEIGDLDVEERKLNLFDFESKKEIATAVDCFVDLHGEKIHVAVQKQIVDKTEKDDAGNYVPTGETRETNEIVKFFPEAGLVTISEVAHFVESLGGSFEEVLGDGDLGKAISKMEGDGNYATTWLEKNRGETWDRSTGKKEGKAFGGGKAKSEGGSGEAKKKSASLFDD